MLKKINWLFIICLFIGFNSFAAEKSIYQKASEFVDMLLSGAMGNLNTAKGQVPVNSGSILETLTPNIQAVPVPSIEDPSEMNKLTKECVSSLTAFNHWYIQPGLETAKENIDWAVELGTQKAQQVLQGVKDNPRKMAVIGVGLFFAGKYIKDFLSNKKRRKEDGFSYKAESLTACAADLVGAASIVGGAYYTWQIKNNIIDWFTKTKN